MISPLKAKRCQSGGQQTALGWPEPGVAVIYLLQACGRLGEREMVAQVEAVEPSAVQAVPLPRALIFRLSALS
jgi:hypothetical protein